MVLKMTKEEIALIKRKVLHTLEERQARNKMQDVNVRFKMASSGG